MGPEETPPTSASPMKAPWGSGAAVGFGFALALSGLAFADGGYDVSLLLRSMGCVIAVIGFLVAGISWLANRHKSNAAMIAGCAAFLAATVPAIRLGAELHREAFAALPARAAPLVRAIEQFEADKGHPPDTLQELIPKYLEAIPATDVPKSPPFWFKRLNSNNRWELRVRASRALSFDYMFYWPTRDYPDWMGGRVERIGDWAYVHE